MKEQVISNLFLLIHLSRLSFFFPSLVGEKTFYAVAKACLSAFIDSMLARPNLAAYASDTKRYGPQLALYAKIFNIQVIV